MLRTAAAAVATFGLATVAAADLVQITASGPISSSNMSAFPVGQTMTIVFTYESVGNPQSIQNNQAFYVNQFRSIQVTSGSYNSSHNGAFGQINKHNNLANTDGIHFQAASNPGYYQFTNPQPAVAPLASVFSNNVTQTFENMMINFESSNSALWETYELPTSYNFAQFNLTQNALFGFSGGSFTLGFNNVSYQIVPAPTTVAPLLLGALTIRRRRR